MMQQSKNKCIILNKAFEGAWNDTDGNISHEIIDFFKADDGKYYVYNSPYGTLRKGIYVNKDGSDEEKDLYIYTPKNKKQIGNKESTDDAKIAQAEYLIIASNAEIEKIGEEEKKRSTFKIKYVIKLKRRLHRLNENNLEIYYGGKCLHDVLGLSKNYPLATFEASWIKEPTEIQQVTTTDYNYQRNRGYVYSDSNPNSFKALNDIIESSLKDEDKWKTLDVSMITPEILTKNVANQNKSFLDLIRKVDSEECYTNLLYEVFYYKNVFNEFLKYLKNQCGLLKNVTDMKFLDEEFKVKREKGVKYGRMDISADSDKVRVFIENKVLSGLNGIKTNHSQITVYNDWATEGKRKSIGLIFVPNYKSEELKNELEFYKETEMCEIVEYSKIRDFLSQDKIKAVLKNNDFKYFKYVDDFDVIFNRHSFADKLDKFRSEFIEAINRCN